MFSQKKVDILKKKLDKAESILITTHLRPDPDAIGSLLAMNYIIETLYPLKKVYVVIESQPPENFSWMDGFKDIEIGRLHDYSVDLIFFLDGSEIIRFVNKISRDSSMLNSVFSVRIDHHEIKEKNKKDFDLHFGSYKFSSTCDVLLELFIKKMKLITLDRNLATLFFVGIWCDIGFGTFGTNLSQSLSHVSQLIKQTDISPEEILNKIRILFNSYTIKIQKEFTKNLKFEKNFAYSYLTDGIINSIKGKVTVSEINAIRSNFLSSVIVRMDYTSWGFVVYPAIDLADSYYTEFRSRGNGKNVFTYAKRLGGGGHKHASGAVIKARSYKEALEKVLSVVK